MKQIHTPNIDPVECIDSRDQVVSPSHYTSSSIEVWDAIVAWNLLFCEGNVIKYVARAEHHVAGKLINLKKAQQYLEKAISIEEKKCAYIEHRCEQCVHWSKTTLKCTQSHSDHFNNSRSHDDDACPQFEHIYTDLSNR